MIQKEVPQAEIKINGVVFASESLLPVPQDKSPLSISNQAAKSK